MQHTDIIIPPVGESITSANLARWNVADQTFVRKGQAILTLETDKVSNDIEAPHSGIIKQMAQEGEELPIGTLVATIEESEEDTIPSTGTTSLSPIDIKVPPSGESITSASVARWHVENGESVTAGQLLVTLDTDKVSNDLEAERDGLISILIPEGEEAAIGTPIAILTPHVQDDVPQESPTPLLEQEKREVLDEEAAPSSSQISNLSYDSSSKDIQESSSKEERSTRKKMSMIRRKIASHLVEAQHTAAILTTFNEVNMQAIIDLRKTLQEDFMAKHGCKLGFMSFFVKAVVAALQAYPAINASIQGEDIITHHYYDIGVAIGTDKGLVVPVLRHCEAKSFAQIEQDILNYAKKAQQGQLTLEDLRGGVFSISNGGVYGSLLSTPIINPPQSAILGMHSITKRAIVVDDQIVIAPMMYLALSYDHRLIDGKEAVSFLIHIKQHLENPSRLLLEV